MNILLRNKRLVLAGLIALLLNFVSLLNLQAQNMNPTEIIIGDGIETSCEVPFRGCSTGWNFQNYSEIIYPSEAIGMTGIIQSISFQFAEVANYSTSMNILMGTTDQSLHSTNNAWTPSETLESVYNSPVVFNEQGWIKIVLEKPFIYEQGNLVVAINANVYSSSSTVVYSSNAEGATLSGSSYGYSGTIHNIRPNIKLEVLAEAALSSVPSSVDMGIRRSGSHRHLYRPQQQNQEHSFHRFHKKHRRFVHDNTSG